MRVANVLRSAVLVLVLVATAPIHSFAAEPQGPASKSPVLTRAQVDALLAKPEQLVVLDVRRPDEHQSKGAFPVFLSIQAGDLEKYLAYIPRDRQILTVSNHAARAGKAADLLASKGFKVAGAVGVETYEQEGGALNKITPPPARSDAAKPAAKPAS